MSPNAATTTSAAMPDNSQIGTAESTKASQSRLLRAIAWNNAGVAELERGEYSSAVRTLSRGLKISQRLLQDGSVASHSALPSLGLVDERIESPPKTTTTAANPEPSVVDCSENAEVNSNMGSIDTTRPPASLQSRAHQVAGKIVYTSAIRIVRANGSRVNGYFSVSSEDISATSGSLIFNLALAHHMRGFYDDEGQRDQQLQISVRLYQLAYQIQSTGPTRMAGILNNLGQALGLMGEHDRAEKFWNILLSFVAMESLLDHGLDPDNRIAVIAKPYAWCLPNILPLMLRSPKTARAA